MLISKNFCAPVVAFVLAAIATSAPTQGQQPFVVEPPQNSMYPDYGPGNVAGTRLRNQPPQLFSFDRASLRDVLRYLADSAGLPFVGMPEGDAANRRLVTFTLEASPFAALEAVCRDNGVRLTFQNGVWYMRAIDESFEKRAQQEEDNKLVGIAYKLVYDPVDRVRFVSAAQAQQNQANENQTTIASASLPLQQSQNVFAASAPRIVNEVRTMLGLPPISYNADGEVIGETAREGSNVAAAVNATQTSALSTEVTPTGQLNPVYVPPQTPQVVYNSDNNTLWVVATRAQHKWIADYLLAVDQPQALIAIEVKFFETTRDPRKELGFNWAGTLADGGFSLTARDIEARVGDPFNLGGLDINSGAAFAQGSQTGVPNQTASAFSFSAGYSAVLTASQVQLALQAFMSDTKTSMVQYPRVLTVNNREVAITTAENTPINAGVTQISASGTGGQNVGTLAYLPVGTQINILPKAIGLDQVAMSVAITISNILPGAITIDLGTGPNQYPRTSQRVYNASLQVNSGYTLAVGGLESVDDSRVNNGIPFLQDIPGVGQLFKSKTRAREKKNLIVFITPTIITNPKATRGIAETPESVIPIRPNDPLPPSFTPDGQLVGGINALNAALAWLELQIRLFKQINTENRTDKESIKQLRAVIATSRMLVTEVAGYRASASPDRDKPLSLQEERAIGVLAELNKTLAVAQDNVM